MNSEVDFEKEVEGLKVKTEEIEKDSNGNVKDLIGYVFILVFLVVVIFFILTKDTSFIPKITLQAKTWLKTIL